MINPWLLQLLQPITVPPTNSPLQEVGGGNITMLTDTTNLDTTAMRPSLQHTVLQHRLLTATLLLLLPELHGNQ